MFLILILVKIFYIVFPEKFNFGNEFVIKNLKSVFFLQNTLKFCDNYCFNSLFLKTESSSVLATNDTNQVNCIFFNIFGKKEKISLKGSKSFYWWHESNCCL